MLKALITSKVKRKLLALFFANPEDEFYIRQLSRKLDEETNAIRRELLMLENAGILISRAEGNLKLYKVNRNSPVFNELKGIILKTEGLGTILRQELKDKGILFAFIYGSYAEGRERKGSDIDLMVIGDVPVDKFNRIISELERKIGRDINYLIYPEKEFIKKLSSGFIRDVVNGKKIMIIGEEDEFKRFIKRRSNKESLGRQKTGRRKSQSR